MPGMPLNSSAATTDEYAMPTASRMPVNVSGSADGHHDVADHLRRDGAESPGGLLQSDRRGDDGGGGGDRGRRQRGQREQRDLRRLVDAEPDDQQEEVGQRRQRPQERQPRLEHAAHPADRAHHQAEQHPERHADDDADEHPAQRHVEVLPQQVARVAADPVVGGRHVDEGAPHGARVRHERLVPDAAGGGELPAAPNTRTESSGSTARVSRPRQGPRAALASAPGAGVATRSGAISTKTDTGELWLNRRHSGSAQISPN